MPTMPSACVWNVRKTAAEGVSRNREVQYVPDYPGSPCSGLVAYETGAGSIRTVFGQGYHRLSQSTEGGRTFFQSDIYGSPLFAADGQGTVLQYAGRGIWGNLEDGTEILPEFVENMGFTSYRYDPVTGKHFAHARFYDDANGRMLAPDPVRRDLNGYRYCGNDPVDYVDPTGEMGIIARTVIGGTLGAVIGGAGGFISSAVSQKLGGGKVDWKKAKGEAIKGAITGAVQGGMVASGVKIPKAVANAANFLAGTIGSAAEQKFARGRVSAGRSILGGIDNMVGNSLYGTDPLSSVKNAAVRGAKAGAASAGLGYLADCLDPAPGWDAAGAAGFAAGIAGSFLPPFGMARDPRRGCGSLSPFNTILGHTMARGYRYGVSGLGIERKKKPSLMGFLGETVRGGVTGGIAGAAFYGVGKGIERLWNGADDFDLKMRAALKELDSSGLRPGQTVISKGKVQYIVNNYDPVMAQSSIYTDSTGRYLVDGHHTTVANIILNRGTGMNMNQASPLPPSTKEVYWVKKWYELGKTAIKIIK